ESPDQYAPRIARGLARSQMAWEARGTDFFRYVPKDDVAVMGQWQRLAIEDLTASVALSGRPLPSIIELMEIAKVRGARKQAKNFLAEGERILPGSAYVYSTYLPSLLADWGGGSVSTAEQFLERLEKDGVDENAWGQLKRGLYNVHHGNVLLRDPRAN